MLKGKNALVTGSTSGIGEGIAKALAAQGCNIMLNGFGDAKEIEALRADIAKQHNVQVRYNGADVTKPDAVAGMVKEAQDAWGSLDILVNNAGIQFVAKVEEFPLDKWDAILATNLSAAFYGVRAALPGMRAKKWGRIINIASAHGLVASPQKSAYVAAKHGIVGLTKVVALETAGSGITCNAICPGWVLTPLVQKQIDDKAKEQKISEEEAEKNLLAEKQPLGKFVTVEQIGALVVYLSSDAASPITGAPLSIDGGWTAE